MSVEKQRILDLSVEYVCPDKVRTFGNFGIDLVIGRREGYRLWDMDGHELFDLHLNGGTYNLGHHNPEVRAALAEAVDTFDMGNHHFPSIARAELAEQLAANTPGDLHYTVFCTSGSEANDVAIKCARRATGRRKIVSLQNSFHGCTGLSANAGEERFAVPFLSDAPPGEFVHVPFNDLDAMAEALRGNDVAGVILETIPATLGFPMPAEDYLPGVKRLCEQHGALFIADEVQTGLGRTGRLWAIEGYGVEPDVLVTAKGFGGGLYPIAATVLTKDVGAWLEHDGWGHVSTGGGAELGCRVAQKVLDICMRPETLENGQHVASHLRAGLDRIQQQHPFLANIRQNGLVMGLQFDHEQGALMMMKALYDSGVWAIFAGYDYSLLQFKPGLLLDEPTCDAILERFETAIAGCQAAAA